MVDAARRGRGGSALLLGEAGVGKSRLAAELAGHAERAGMLVLRGRAVEGTHPVTFRPLTEALLVAAREGALPTAHELDGFAPVLGQLLPGEPLPDRDTPTGNRSLLAVAEGCLRLLRLLGRSRGCLLVLEDLHWTDPETLAVLEYLADHAAGDRLAVLVTLRAERATPAARLASALDARGVARRITLPRLTDVELRRMVRACLSTEQVPPAVETFVVDRSDGLPFFAEELLVGLINSRALVRDGGAWRAVNRLVPAVPLTVTASIQQRLAGEPRLSDVLQAAAVLGRRFDWTLLPDITGQPEAAVLDALRAGALTQLLDTDPDGFRFRHALTRDAVLATLLPPEHGRLATAAAGALHARYPALDGDRCALAAGLHEVAGEHTRAAELLLTAADRAARRGALGSAEALLRRARELAGEESLSADMALLHVLALGGHTARVHRLGERLLPRLRALDDRPHQAEVLCALARAEVAAGLWARAADHVEAAGKLADDEPVEHEPVGGQRVAGEATSAAVAVLAAQVAMGRGGEAEATRLAEVALATAIRLDLSEVACEALEILGRVVRAADPGAAEQLFERALGIAERGGLAVWRLRALHELGTLDLLDTGPPDRLEAARAAAVEAGALSTLAVIDLHLGDLLTVSGRAAEAAEAMTRCVALSRRLALATLPVALCHLAAQLSRAGRLDAAEELLAEAVQLAPDDPDVLIGVPITRAMGAFGRADYPAARRQLEAAASVHAAHPTVPFPLRGLWALLCTVSDSAATGPGLTSGARARERVRASGALGIRLVRASLGYADAAAAGQAGQPAEADRLFRAADLLIRDCAAPDELLHTTRPLLVGSARRDGWGAPLDWLREALGWAETVGQRHVAAHCHAALRQAGEHVGRPVRAGDVPERLRALGVTGREMQVLTLVVEGLTNADIGGRLFISPRTVEKHVQSLFSRTGTRNRGQLAVRAERLRGPRMG